MAPVWDRSYAAQNILLNKDLYLIKSKRSKFQSVNIYMPTAEKNVNLKEDELEEFEL